MAAQVRGNPRRMAIMCSILEVSCFSWFHKGDTPNVLPAAAKIVEFIKDNMIELALEGFLDDERLADNAGFLVGWMPGENLS